MPNSLQKPTEINQPQPKDTPSPKIVPLNTEKDIEDTSSISEEQLKQINQKGIIQKIRGSYLAQCSSKLPLSQVNKIVIIGGGAGGLELATRLGNKLGKKKLAQITLVDPNLSHVWKPLWHEIAAGTFIASENEINYLDHSHKHCFDFKLGSLSRLDRQKKLITLAAITENGETSLPERVISYDTLILAIGSVSNDFNINGVKEFCYSLDSYQDCLDFHKQFITKLLRLKEKYDNYISIVIIGGGATGVELAAELHFAYSYALQLSHVNFNSLTSKVQISIIESSSRILSSLPAAIAKFASKKLKQKGIKIILNENVVKIDKDNIYTKSGKVIQADLKVWAAGIKGPEILTTLNLKINPKHQLLVKQTLQTLDDENIFAFGDCASCPQPNTQQTVPPKAQAAHQQAILLSKSLIRQLIYHKQPLSYFFHDYGSLITLSQEHALGHYKGSLIKDITLKGKLASLAYRWLFRRYQIALFGWWTVFLLIISQALSSSVRPRLKLH